MILRKLINTEIYSINGIVLDGEFELPNSFKVCDGHISAGGQSYLIDEETENFFKESIHSMTDCEIKELINELNNVGA